MKWMHHRCLLAPRLHERNARNMAKRGLQKKITGYISAILVGRESSFQEEKQKESPEKMSFSKEQKNEKNVPKYFFGGENLKKDVSRFFFFGTSRNRMEKTKKKRDSDSLVSCLALLVSATYLLGLLWLWRRCYTSLASCNASKQTTCQSAQKPPRFLPGPLLLFCAVPKNRDSAFFNLGTLFSVDIFSFKKKSQGSTYYNKPPPFPFLPTTSSPFPLPHLPFKDMVLSLPQRPKNPELRLSSYLYHHGQ